MISDKLNRPIHDLRISIIDRCNFRCPYCMPEGRHSFLKEDTRLNFDEIVRLATLFVKLGVKKLRLTGGEPLLRPNIENLVSRLAQLSGPNDLALTTNGSLLTEKAVSLKRAGLQRITVSLDALEPEIFKTMSGDKGNVLGVLNGIKAAEEAGFFSVKINVVVKKGINDRQILDIVEYFRGTQHVVRFIEYMDVGTCNHWQLEEVLASKDIIRMIDARYPLQAQVANYRGEVSSRYAFEDGKGEVGFISSITQPFCGDCSRARLSTDGKLFTCLFAKDGVDLKIPIRSGASDNEILDLITKTWSARTDRYSEERASFIKSQTHTQKIEMFQIGG
ncbi:MAG: cyclic pyranopterin phosphate synthase [Omnitrophica WOR_2 bacterium GWA2_47_8]|nr:MAG: cyclic pyranopterin phosphate synthase [Omnitrophica WOR_2 bacterium GWA2_47_8]